MIKQGTCTKMFTSEIEKRNQIMSQASRDPELEKIEMIAEHLAKDIIDYKTQLHPKTPSPLAKIMRKTVDEMIDRHNILLKNIGCKLNVQRDTYRKLAVKVLDEMFNDNNVNWGRIVAIFAFISELALYCQEHNMADVIDLLPTLVREYISSRLSTWILTHQGWESFRKNYSGSQETENKIFKTLLFTGIGLGVLAGIVAAQ